MKNTLRGYARCSADKQDLAAQRTALGELGVELGRIYHLRVSAQNCCVYLDDVATKNLRKE
jgi:hypothetical protein